MLGVGVPDGSLVSAPAMGRRFPDGMISIRWKGKVGFWSLPRMDLCYAFILEDRFRSGGGG